MTDRVSLMEFIKHYRNKTYQHYERCPIGEENFGRCERTSYHFGPHKKFDEKGNVTRMWPQNFSEDISNIGLMTVFLSRMFLFAIVPAILTYLTVSVTMGIPLDIFPLAGYEVGMGLIENMIILIEEAGVHFIAFLIFLNLWGFGAGAVWIGGSWLAGIVFCPSIRKYIISLDEYYEENYEKYAQN